MAYSQPSYMPGCDEQVFITNADGSGTPRRFPMPRLSGCPLGTPVWSPDGSQIAITQNGKDSWPEIYVIDVSPEGATGRPRALQHKGLLEAEAPSWSPDGTEIAFLAAGDIYKIDVNRLEKTRLTHSPLEDTQPTWSPDGEQIAYVKQKLFRGTHASIYKMNSDGSNSTPVFEEEKMYAFNPDWAP